MKKNNEKNAKNGEEMSDGRIYKRILDFKRDADYELFPKLKNVKYAMYYSDIVLVLKTRLEKHIKNSDFARAEKILEKLSEFNENQIKFNEKQKAEQERTKSLTVKDIPVLNELFIEILNNIKKRKAA